MDKSNGTWRERYGDWLTSVDSLLGERQYGAAFRTYPWVTFHNTPFTRPSRPLGEMRVALVGSCGLSIPGQAPFDESNPLGDSTFRWIPGEKPLPAWRIDHGHYDPAAAREDYNSVFPIDALRELSEEHVIGALAPRHVSFMGYQTDPWTFLANAGEEIVDGLRSHAVDGVLLVPV